MVPTRRQVLSGTAALLAALAGCNSTTDPPTPTESPDPGRFERPENVAMDPPTVKLRRPGFRDPIIEIQEDEDTEMDQTEREYQQTVRRGFITSPEEASLLRIDDVENAETARQFIDETDFDTEFLFLDRGGVRQCYKQLLCYVTWTDFELRRTYAEVYRDYDVTCSRDERDRLARFIRLEGSVDIQQIEDEGTRTHRGGCPVPRWQRTDRSQSNDTITTGSDTAANNEAVGTNAGAANRGGGR